MARPIQHYLPNEEARAYWRSVMEAKQTRAAFDVPDVPVCPTCGGLGVVKYDVPVGHEHFGKMFPCPDPNCQTARANSDARYKRISTAAQIPTTYRKMTISAWHNLAEQFPYDPNRSPEFDYMAGKWAAYGAACLFIERAEQGFRFGLDEVAERFGLPLPEIDTPKRRGFVLSGKNGVGKTSLAVAIANELINQYKPVVYVRLDDFWAALRERFTQKTTYEYAEDAEDEASVMRLYQQAPVLIVDEFTPDKLTDWRLNMVHQLINYRYTNDLPTLITTNTKYEEFRDLWSVKDGVTTTGDRVLAMCHWIEMVGLNLRPVADKWVSP